jgi:hypothetical protein
MVQRESHSEEDSRIQPPEKLMGDKGEDGSRIMNRRQAAGLVAVVALTGSAAVAGLSLLKYFKTMDRHTAKFMLTTLTPLPENVEDAAKYFDYGFNQVGLLVDTRRKYGYLHDSVEMLPPDYRFGFIAGYIPLLLKEGGSFEKWGSWTDAARTYGEMRKTMELMSFPEPVNESEARVFTILRKVEQVVVSRRKWDYLRDSLEMIPEGDRHLFMGLIEQRLHEHQRFKRRENWIKEARDFNRNKSHIN